MDGKPAGRPSSQNYLEIEMGATSYLAKPTAGDYGPQAPGRPNDPTDNVLVRVENNYVCGRESERYVWLPGPDADESTEAWFEDVVHDHTGDGHPCGSSEHALYEATVLVADDHPHLVDEHTSWEG